jgi:hypothetical protein
MDEIEVGDHLQQVEVESGSREALPAWEMIESGRYRPRRIRGSFHGRELG